MRPAFLLVSAILLSSACDCTHAQSSSETLQLQTPGNTQHPSAPTGHITGTVMCGDTHRPARGAMVMIVRAPTGAEKRANGGLQMMSRVAMDGSYHADRVASGEYVVMALLPGYVSPIDDMMSGEFKGKGDAEAITTRLSRYGTVSVQSGGSARFDLTLERGAAVSGRVLYSDGAPATQVTIDLENTASKIPASTNPEENINAGAVMRSLFTHQSASTDDQGHFRIAGLPAGKYRLAAVQQPTEMMNDREGVGMIIGMVTDPRALHMYSGDTLHKRDAKVYDLHAGDEVSDITVTLPVDAFHAVHGTVTAKDGRPLNMGSLTLTDAADDSLVFRTELQRDGTFVFPNVPSGNYTLAASRGRIGKPMNGYPAELPLEYAQLQATDAFANGSIGVLVKDSDVTDVVLALDPMALPKDEQPQENTVKPAGNADPVD